MTSLKVRGLYASLALVVSSLVLANCALLKQPSLRRDKNRSVKYGPSGHKFLHTKLSSEGGALDVTLVERLDGTRRKRGTHNDDNNKWPHVIPYVIDSSFSKECPPRWTTYKQRCVRYYSGPVSHEQALEACQLQSMSGTLFQVHNLQDQSWLNQFWQDQSSRAGKDLPPMWISGVRTTEKAGWMFTGYPKAMSYFNWSSPAVPYNGVRQCIKMADHSDTSGNSGTWETTPCDSFERNAFVCQIHMEDSDYYVQMLKRVMKLMGQHMCVTYQDQTDHYNKSSATWFSDHGFGTDAYILIRDGGGCAAANGPGNSGKGSRGVSPCRGFGIMLHEMFHTVGGMHVQQEPIRDNYVSIYRDNISPSLQGTYDRMPHDHVINQYFDAKSTLLYGDKTWSRNALETYVPIRDDIFDTDAVVSSENVMFMEVSKSYRCNEKFCNGAQTDCGPGYYTLVNDVCRCVCPEEYDPDTNCQKQINHASKFLNWPSTPMVVLAGGSNHQCPSGFTQQPGWLSFTGIWAPLQKPVPVKMPNIDKTMYMPLCSRSMPDTAQHDWGSWPIGGNFCFIKSKQADCGGVFSDYVVELQSLDTVVTNGTIGDVDISGDNITIRLCCSDIDHFATEIELPNDKPFRVWSINSCPRVKGMRWYRAMVDFYTTNKAVYGVIAPNYYIFGKELQLFECYYQPAVYGCNQEHRLDKDTRSVDIVTPGFGVAREPDRRCFYNFYAPEGSRLRLTFDTFDIEEDDKVTVKRYHQWQEGHGMTKAESHQQLVSEGSYLAIQYWAGWQDVANMGLSFTVDLLPAEEFCYDVTKNGSDYTGATNVSETMEPCLTWAEVTDCSDFDFTGEEALHLLTSNNWCRNPSGRLKQPWCYTYKNGTNCRKRYCDVCNYEAPYDKLQACGDLVAHDPELCHTALHRFGCYKTCAMADSPHNECPAGWMPHGDRCFHVSTEHKTQREAEAECSTQGVSGTLFHVESLADQAALTDIRHRLGLGFDEAVWIGGELDKASGDWLFTDTKAKMTYFNWTQPPASSSPTPMCVQLLGKSRPSSEGAWLAAPCDRPDMTSTFVCQLTRRATCGPPSLPHDGTLVGALRPFYVEGEQLVIRCNNYYPDSQADSQTNTIRCEKSGWTQLQHACSYVYECPQNWTLYQDRCFQFELAKHNRSDSEKDCRSRGPTGTLFQVRNVEDQLMVRDYKRTNGGQYTDANWISGELRADRKWYFTDTNVTMTYFNWSDNVDTDNINQNCLRLVAEYLIYSNRGGWRGQNCDDPAHDTHYICQLDRQVIECRDRLSTCAELLTVFPTLCTDSHTADTASQYCLWSCGKCPATMYNKKCVEPPGATYQRISDQANIHPGEVMTFTCDPDHFHTGGDLQRACSTSGRLLGTVPLCQDQPAYLDIQVNSVRARGDKLDANMAILLDHDGYRVPFTGHISRWFYQCKKSGELNFLVYRPTGSSYTYVGGNNITCEEGWGWSYAVPAHQRISVWAGDVVGVVCPSANTLSVTDCNGADEKLMVNPAASGQQVGKDGDFSLRTCLIPSLGFRVQP